MSKNSNTENDLEPGVLLQLMRLMMSRKTVLNFVGYLGAGTLATIVATLVRQYEINANGLDWYGGAGMLEYCITAGVLGGLWDKFVMPEKRIQKGGWLISMFVGFIPLAIFASLGYI